MDTSKFNGIIPDVVIKPVETDPDLIKKIAKIRNLPEKYVSDVLRYNVISFPQLQTIAACSHSYLSQITNGSINNKEGQKVFALNICYPFPVEGTRPWKFIFRNPKFNKWLENKIKEDAKRHKAQQSKSAETV